MIVVTYEGLIDESGQFTDPVKCPHCGASSENFEIDSWGTAIIECWECEAEFGFVLPQTFA